jgi:hypothetical protein
MLVIWPPLFALAAVTPGEMVITQSPVAWFVFGLLLALGIDVSIYVVAHHPDRPSDLNW